MNGAGSPRASKLESYGAKEDIPGPLGAKKGTKGDNIKSYLELGLWSDSAEYDCELNMHGMMGSYGSKITFTKPAYTVSLVGRGAL